MAELIPTASEAEWLAARRSGVTASEIAVIMGLSPYSSPYALYHQKLGILPQQDDSGMMERGRVLEPYIAQKFAAAHPEFIVDGTGRELYSHWSWPWRMATPDRLLFGYEVEPETNGTILTGLEAVLECKVDGGSDDWGEPGTGEIPVHYRCQVLWQMYVMDVKRAYVACLNVPRWQVREYVVDMNEDAERDLRLMFDAAALFRQQLSLQDPPDVDWRPATAYALKQLHPSVEDRDTIVGDRLAANYKAAVKNLKHWEQRKKLYEARIRQQMGSARRAFTAVGSEPVCRRDVYEVKAHERKASTVDKLVPVYPKKEKNVSADSE